MSRTRSFFILLALAVTLASLFWSLIPSDEQEVYEAVFIEVLKGKKESFVAISKPSVCNIQSKPNNLKRELYEALVAANEQWEPVRLKSLEPFVPTADSKELARYESTGVSTRALIRDDRTLLFLSRVGFSSDGNEAVFCVRRSDVGYADNSYFVVKKVDGGWVIDTYQVVSVS